MAAHHSKCFSFLLCALQLFMLGCGGKAFQPQPTSQGSIAIRSNDVLNMGMIGQKWLFKNGRGDINTFTIEPPEATTRTNADGSVTRVTFTDPGSQAAGRGGNNLVLHMTKSADCSYWMLCVPEAEIWFLLHQNPDGSWRSTASLMNLPRGCPWCAHDGLPATAALTLTSDVLDNQAGMALPYMIAPPDAKEGDHLIFETRVGATGVFGELTFDDRLENSQLTGPHDGEYWRTDFYVTMVNVPAYSGPAIVSDQYEGTCGHERWYFAPGKGIVKIESPYDGGEVKNNPICVFSGAPETHDPLLTIERIN